MFVKTRSSRLLVLLSLLSLLVALSLIVAACGGDEETTTTAGGSDTTAAPADTTTTAAPSGPIVIGFSGPLTGDGAAVGQDYLNGANLYLEKVNADGGVNGQQVEIQAEDDLMDPKNSTTVAQKLVDAGVVGILGPLTSGSTIPTLKIYGDAAIPQLTPASNPDVTAQGFTHVFRVDPDDLAQGGNIGNYVFNELGKTKVAIIHDKQAFGQGVAEQFQAAFEAAGGTVTSVNGITPGDVDFRAVLTKIQSEGPELVYYGGIYKEAGLIVKQMRELGMEQDFFGPDQVYNPDFITVGGPATEGAYVSFQAPPFDSTPELQAFYDEYKAEFNSDPIVAHFGYDSAILLTEAMKKAGSTDGQTLIDTLHASEIPGVLGVYAFEENGALKGGGTIHVYQVKDGAFAYVGPSEAQ